jgi:hypothetical protein
VIEESKTQCPEAQLFLWTPPPIDENCSKRRHETYSQYVSIVRKVGADKNIPVFDLHNILLIHIGHSGESPLPGVLGMKGQLKKITNDGVYCLTVRLQSLTEQGVTQIRAGRG